MTRKKGITIKLDADTEVMDSAVIGRNGMGVVKAKGESLLNTKDRGEYDDRFHPVLAFRICRETGATTREVAAVFNVSLPTVTLWMQAHPRLKKAIRVGKDLFDCEKVESSLLERALGINKTVHREFKKTKVLMDPETKLPMIDPDTKKAVTYDEVTVSDENVYIPPDVKACQFWLNNRNKRRWAMSPVMKTKVREDHKFLHMDFGNCTDEELRNLKEITEKATRKIKNVTPRGVTEKDYAALAKEDPDIFEEVLSGIVKNVPPAKDTDNDNDEEAA